MKNSLFLILVFISLLVNSCAYNKITFGHRNKTDKTEEIVEVEENSTSIIDLNDEQEYVSPNNSNKANSEEESTVQRLSLKLDEKIQKTDGGNVETIKKIISLERLELRSHKLEREPTQNRESSDGVVFVVIGSILLVIGIAVILSAIYKIDNATVDGNGGCLNAIVAGTMLIALGSIIGIVGIVLLIIGLVIISAN